MKMNLTYPLILASNSPRRRQLLAEAGFEFKVQTKEVDESFPSGLKATEVARYITQKKIDSYKDWLHNQIVICADTTVVNGDTLLEKPSNTEEAFEMIAALSGGTHQVITGVAIGFNEETSVFDCTTQVKFATLLKEEIEFYVEKYRPYDKAGAYGIQEWIGLIGIESITGSYFNVVGLPVHLIYQRLKELGLVSLVRS